MIQGTREELVLAEKGPVRCMGNGDDRISSAKASPVCTEKPRGAILQLLHIAYCLLPITYLRMPIA